jgi:alginate O-acetyltransferase complex protein AlgI
MLFNSLEFLVFFPIVTLLYFTIPHRWQWLWLLTVSCLFYMWAVPVYIVFLAVSVLIDFFAAQAVEAAVGKRKKLFLMLSIISNLTLLGIFKYYNFFVGNLAALAHLLGWQYQTPHFNVLLPIGISFYTFQTLSYTFEVYRGHCRAQRHFGRFALFVTFFPQLVAGPIERPQDLLPQFEQEHRFEYRRVVFGLQLMVWGMFKKVVIADNFAKLVNPVYADPHSFNGLQLFIATALFPSQIYCDFSGYSDIALGAAQVMGFSLTPNFRQPFLSRSLAEFWKRWNITIMNWFRDYIYATLRKPQEPVWKKQLKQLFVFLLSGLWHGADWTFVVWGGVNGLYLIIGKLTVKIRKQIAAWCRLTKYPVLQSRIQIVITFVLVVYSSIFFRAQSFADGIYIAGHWFEKPNYLQSFQLLKQSLATVFAGKFEFLFTLAMAVILMSIETQQRQNSLRERISRLPAIVRWSLYAGFILFILLFGEYGGSRFIYFQF